MEKQPSTRTINIDVTDQISDTQRCDIEGTVADSKVVFEIFKNLGIEHKSTSYMRMHKYGYQAAKDACPHIPASVLQDSAKEALSNLNAWNSNNRNKKWQYEGKKSNDSYPLNARTLARRGNLTTFSSNGSRIRIIHELPQWFEDKYPEKKLQAGHVLIRKNRIILSLSYRIPDSKHREGSIIGIDRGLYNHIAASDGTLVSSKHLHSVERRYAYTKSTLQSKGTRSAKKRLKAIAGREMRFRQDFDHCVSKSLSEREDVSCYVLEDLTGLREKRKDTKLNRWLHKWSTARFTFYLEYKCKTRGIDIVYVDPSYTSQMCSCCGNIDRNARRQNHYVCSACGFKEHSDINAAINIRDRHLLTLAGEPGHIHLPVCSDSSESGTIL